MSAVKSGSVLNSFALSCRRMNARALLTAASALVAVLSAATNVVTLLHLSPFAADVLSSALLLSSATAWLTGSSKHGKQKHKRLPPEPHRRSTRMIAAVALCVGAVWIGRLPAASLASGAWTLCATYVSTCQPVPCLTFLDGLNRPIQDACYSADDDSGFKLLRRPHWWIYRPEAVQIQCNGQTRAYELPQAAFSNACDVSVRLR